MEKLGGGGHMTVAGAQVSSTTDTNEVKNMITDVVGEMLDNGEI